MDQGGGVVSRFSVEKFLSHSAENFRRGYPLVFHLFRLSKKFASERVEYQDFLSKIFCVTVPKTSVGDSFCCINFGYRKSLDKRGVIKILRRKIICLTVPKAFAGEPFRVSQILVIEKV